MYTRHRVHTRHSERRAWAGVSSVEGAGGGPEPAAKVRPVEGPVSPAGDGAAATGVAEAAVAGGRWFLSTAPSMLQVGGRVSMAATLVHELCSETASACLP
jgi:hypothetical protein